MEKDLNCWFIEMRYFIMQQKDLIGKKPSEGMRTCKQNLWKNGVSISIIPAQIWILSGVQSINMFCKEYASGIKKNVNKIFIGACVRIPSCEITANNNLLRLERRAGCASGWAAARLSPLITLGNFIISRLQTIRRRHTAHVYG